MRNYLNIGIPIYSQILKKQGANQPLVQFNFMKNITILFLFFFTIFSFSQEKNKIFVNAGPSYYPYMKENKNNFNISINFMHQTKKEKWSMEYYYSYSQNDSSFPSFYYDEKVLFRYIRFGNPETIFEDTKWNKIEIVEIGSKLHYLILKNQKINLSINIGLGLNYEKEELHRLLFIDVDQNNSIYGYGNLTVSQWGINGAVFPGIHFDYDLGQKILLAIDGGYHLDANTYNTNVSNTTFWNFSLGIGKKF